MATVNENSIAFDVPYGDILHDIPYGDTDATTTAVE